MFVEIRSNKLVNVKHIVEVELVKESKEGFKWIITLSNGSKEETPVFKTLAEASKWKLSLIATALKNKC